MSTPDRNTRASSQESWATSWATSRATSTSSETSGDGIRIDFAPSPDASTVFSFGEPFIFGSRAHQSRESSLPGAGTSASSSPGLATPEPPEPPSPPHPHESARPVPPLVTLDIPSLTPANPFENLSPLFYPSSTHVFPRPLSWTSYVHRNMDATPESTLPASPTSRPRTPQGGPIFGNLSSSLGFPIRPATSTSTSNLSVREPIHAPLPQRPASAAGRPFPAPTNLPTSLSVPDPLPQRPASAAGRPFPAPTNLPTSLSVPDPLPRPASAGPSPFSPALADLATLVMPLNANAFPASVPALADANSSAVHGVQDLPAEEPPFMTTALVSAPSASSPSHPRAPEVGDVFTANATPDQAPARARPATPTTPANGTTTAQAGTLVIRDTAQNQPEEVGSSWNMRSIADGLEAVVNGADENPAPPLLLLAPVVADAQSPGPARRRRSRLAARPSVGNRARANSHNQDEAVLPPHPFYTPAVQGALAEARDAMLGLHAVLGSGVFPEGPGPISQRLRKEAHDLARFECSSTRIVGIVGVSGVGKSSLVNALLDADGLARMDSAVDACTSVVTEYHYHEEMGFAIEVELFTMEEMADQLREQLQSFRQYHERLRGHPVEGETEDHGRDLEDRARKAWDMFRPMFRGRLPNEQCLMERPQADVLADLLRWSEELAPAAVGGRRSFEALRDCSMALMHLTSKTAGEQPATWPFIRKVKVYLNRPILSNGVVLVDLPGLRDPNSARQMITENYLRECDMIFAVSTCNRITPTAGIEDVFDLAQRAGLSNLNIVCTKSDHVNPHEAIDAESRRLQADVANSETNVYAINIEIKRLKDLEKEDELFEDEKQQLADLEQQLPAASETFNQRNAKLKTHRITTVKRDMTVQYKAMFDRYVPDGTLNVFCVSNTDYWLQRRLDAVGNPHLLELSGIPEVRRHCRTLVGDSNMRAASHFVHGEVPALLGRAELWVESSAGDMAAEQKRRIGDILSTFERSLRDTYSNIGVLLPMGGLSREMNTKFEAEIYRNCCQARVWSKAAGEKAKEWRSWAAASYLAFVRDYGDNNTGLKKDRNWNWEAISKMVTDLRPHWQKLRRDLAEQEAALRSDMRAASADAIRRLDAELRTTAVESPDTITTTLASQDSQLDVAIDKLCHRFETGLSKLEGDALSGVRTSLITRAMEGIYRKYGAEIAGPGSQDKLHALILRKLSAPDTFHELMWTFKTRFRLLANALHDDLHRKASDHLESIRQTLDSIRGQNALLESEKDPGLRDRVAAEVASARNVLQRVQAAF